MLEDTIDGPVEEDDVCVVCVDGGLAEGCGRIGCGGVIIVGLAGT